MWKFHTVGGSTAIRMTPVPVPVRGVPHFRPVSIVATETNYILTATPSYDQVYSDFQWLLFHSDFVLANETRTRPVTSGRFNR